MRVMVIVKATPDTESGRLPSTDELSVMGQFNEQLAEAGVLLAGEGVHPSSKGARVRFSDGKQTVTEGPFAETKELLAGFWLWQVSSLDEALAWAKRCPMPEGAELELRPVFDPDDFGEAFTPELREKEERMRAEARAEALNEAAGLRS